MGEVEKAGAIRDGKGMPRKRWQAVYIYVVTVKKMRPEFAEAAAFLYVLNRLRQRQSEKRQRRLYVKISSPFSRGTLGPLPMVQLWHPAFFPMGKYGMEKPGDQVNTERGSSFSFTHFFGRLCGQLTSTVALEGFTSRSREQMVRLSW